MAAPPFAYGPDGAPLVTTDGPELLVHDGETEAPRWTRTLAATVVGVGVTDRFVVAVAAEGTLVACDRQSGEVARTVALERLAVALAAARGGVVAVLGASSVNVVQLHEGEGRIEIDVPGATVVAVDAAGERVAVGTDSGLVRIHDAATGELRGRVQAPAALTGITWSPRGYWIASTKRALARVSADGRDVIAFLESTKLEYSLPACSEDGALVAVRVGDSKVGLFDLLDLGFQGLVAYERPVGQLAFGEGAWLGIGLDLGDGNKVDLRTGAVHRTDPHPGRTRNSWVLLSDPKTEQIAKVLERARARGARWVVEAAAKAEAAKQAAPLASAEPERKTSVWLWVALGLIVIRVLLKLISG